MRLKDHITTCSNLDSLTHTHPQQWEVATTCSGLHVCQLVLIISHLWTMLGQVRSHQVARSGTAYFTVKQTKMFAGISTNLSCPGEHARGDSQRVNYVAFLEWDKNYRHSRIN